MFLVEGLWDPTLGVPHIPHVPFGAEDQLLWYSLGFLLAFVGCVQSFPANPGWENGVEKTRLASKLDLSGEIQPLSVK